MLDWKKYILQKRRSAFDEGTNQKNIVKNIFQSIDEMHSHFCKLFSHLIKITSNQNQSGDVNILLAQIQQFSISEIPNQNQHKFITLFYRKIKTLINNFEDQFHLVQDFDNILKDILNSQQISLTSFFKQCCLKIAQQIRKINEWKRKVNKIQQKDEIPLKQKLLHKDLSIILCNTIYNILQIERVQACFQFIEGAGIIDNVNFVYDKQITKNKKTKKQLHRYFQSFSQKKDVKKVATIVKLQTINNRQKSLSNLSRKKISKNNILSHQINIEKQNKAIKSNSTFHKQNIKLQPIFKTRQKLILLR